MIGDRLVNHFSLISLSLLYAYIHFNIKVELLPIFVNVYIYGRIRTIILFYKYNMLYKLSDKFNNLFGEYNKNIGISIYTKIYINFYIFTNANKY